MQESPFPFLLSCDSLAFSCCARRHPCSGQDSPSPGAESGTRKVAEEAGKCGVLPRHPKKCRTRGLHNFAAWEQTRGNTYAQGAKMYVLALVHLCLISFL